MRDTDLFDAAQRARAANRKNVASASVAGPAHTYSLSGLAVCATAVADPLQKGDLERADDRNRTRNLMFTNYHAHPCRPCRVVSLHAIPSLPVR